MIFSKDFQRILSPKGDPLKKILILFLAGFSLLILISCSTSRKSLTSHLSSLTQRDTLYINTFQYDSIYVHDSTLSNYHIGTIDTLYLSRIGASLRVDTVYREHTSTNFKYRLLRDTIYNTNIEVLHDSIPYQVTVTEVKEVPRSRNWFDHLCYTVTGIITALFILWLLRKFNILSI